MTVEQAHHPVFARIYTKVAALAEGRGGADHRRTLLVSGSPIHGPTSLWRISGSSVSNCGQNSKLLGHDGSAHSEGDAAG